MTNAPDIPSRSRLVRLAICAADAVELWSAVEYMRDEGAAQPLPTLCDGPEVNCERIARWLSDVCGPYATKLERQRLFRKRFGSQVQRRWFP